MSEDSHGIRMDTYIREETYNSSKGILELNVYDIEPDKKESKKNELPKRSRYYGDLVDVQLLQKNADYKDLPELITIFILSYDPFGKDAMCYEVETIVTTHPDIVYNDGIRRI